MATSSGRPVLRARWSATNRRKPCRVKTCAWALLQALASILLRPHRMVFSVTGQILSSPVAWHVAIQAARAT